MSASSVTCAYSSSVVCTSARPSRAPPRAPAPRPSSNAVARRTPHPVRGPRRRDLPGQVPAQPPDQVIDAFGAPWRSNRVPPARFTKTGAASKVRHRQVGARLAQLPQVLPVEPVQLIGDEHPPEGPALDPDPVRMLAGNHLDERGVAAAECASRGAATPAPLPGEGRPRQEATTAAGPRTWPVHCPLTAFEPCADASQIASICRRREHRRRHVPGGAHPDHRPLTAPLAGHVLQHRLIGRPPAVHHPHQVPAERDAVQLAEPVTGGHRPQPGADRRLGATSRAAARS